LAWRTVAGSVLIAFIATVMSFATLAQAGPSSYAISYSQFPLGFYASNASTPFSSAYYVAVAPYGDSDDDNLSFLNLAGTPISWDATPIPWPPT
jgi:hypothetical protein